MPGCIMSQGLLLGPHEEHGAVVGHGLLDEVIGLVDQTERLEEVDDVDAVTLHQDVLLHLGVPTTGLVSEVDAGLQHFAHGDLCHVRTFHCRLLPGHVHLRATPRSRPTQDVADMARIRGVRSEILLARLSTRDSGHAQ